MQFYSLAFLLFMVVTLLAYYLVGRTLKKGQWVVLLVASLSFYAFFGWQNFVFIGITALSTWLGGLAFGKLEAASKAARKQVSSRDEKKAIKKRYTARKRLVLLAMLLINFGVLAYIKYAEVIVGYLTLGSGWATGLLLPLGISFYTFQSISYVIDTYNAKYEPQENFAKHLLFVSYFPQLIQGPINRYDILGEQLLAPHTFDWRESRGALLQIGFGAMKKFVIADILVEYVDAIFTGQMSPSVPGSLVVTGILIYAFYQYADFSGGIDMVLGFSHLFGIKMADNFRQPYFSVSLGDFWRRWHITLGAWMRDYVFYPMALLPGMQRWGKHLTKYAGKHIGRTLPACVANIVVFFLVGLWHGADPHFILWGLYNGIVIAASDLLKPLWDRMNKLFRVNLQGTPHHVFCVIRTFIVVNIGWYFDLIQGAGNLAICFHNTLFNFAPTLLLPEFTTLFPSARLVRLALVAVALLVLLIVSIQKERGVDVEGSILKANPVLRGILYGFIIVLTVSSLMFVSGGGFMYANF